jgi:hypothetical protein
MHHSNIVVIIVAICNDISPKLGNPKQLGDWKQSLGLPQ